MSHPNEILNKLFGSPYKTRLVRFFISNPDSFFSFDEISMRTKIQPAILRREIILLSRINLIRHSKKNSAEKWILNSSFIFLRPLKNLILSSMPVSGNELLEKLKKIGRLKLIILSGVLIQEENDSKIDVMIVGDNIKKGALVKILKNIESDLGREISYALMSTNEFRYRFDIRDKFIREILESPHQKILDRLKIF